MSIEHWLAFVAASAIMLAIPGPTILLVISYALGHGRRSTAATVAGVALGDFTAMTASMLGLGALLATSAAIFTVLKWAGAAYLVWLGIKLWRAPVADTSAPDAGEAPVERPIRIFFHTYVVTALNPKSIVFFVAFLPQFPRSDTAPVLPDADFRNDVSGPGNAECHSLCADGVRRPKHDPKAENPDDRQPHRRFAADRRRTADGRNAARRRVKGAQSLRSGGR